VLQAVKPKAEYQRLQQVPGSAGAGDGDRAGEWGVWAVASAGDYASYCRRSRASGGPTEEEGREQPQERERYLAWAFAEAAVYAVRFYPRIAAWYERKKRRRNVPVAMKALACKLAKAAWHVMRGQAFNEAMLFG